MKRDTAKAAALAAKIETRLAQLGITEAEACRRADLHRDTVRNIRRGSMLGAERLRALAVALGMRADALIGETIDADQGLAQSAVVGSPATRASVDDMATFPMQAGALDLRLYRPRHPADMNAITRDEAVGLLPRPTELAGRSEAYGVYVDDDLNAPIVRQGHVAYVDPSRPVQIGGMVRAFVRGGAAFLAVLEGRTADAVQLRVAAEPAARSLATGQVAKLERVVGFMLLEA